MNIIGKFTWVWLANLCMNIKVAKSQSQTDSRINATVLKKGEKSETGRMNR